MANISAPYSSLKIDNIKPARGERGLKLWQDRMSFLAIETDTTTSWTLARTLLTGVVLLAGPDAHSASLFGKPARIEFIMGEDTFTTRGLVIFDEGGHLIVHIVNALLGYGGSGPALSEDILELIGVPKDIFTAIQDAVDQRGGTRPYKVIVTREHSPDGSWHWMHAR